MNGNSRRSDWDNGGGLREVGGGPPATDRWTPSLIGFIAFIIIIIILFLIGMI
jgi:hypothetical protein